MKFSCEKSVLLNALVSAARSVPARSTLPVLEGMLIEVEDGKVTITGYNLETGIISELQAETSANGAVVVPAKMIVDIVRRLPDERLEFSTIDDDMVRVLCGASDFKIKGMPAEQYPKLPAFSRDYSFSLPQRLLKSMLSQTLFAVAQNENKVIHTGALFEMADGVLNIVTLDGFRLAVRREETTGKLENVKFVAPGQALGEVERVLKDGEETVEIIVGGALIMFDVEGTRIISRLLEGEFLDYNAAIPKEQPIELTVNIKSLIESVERVALLVNDRVKNPVRLIIEKDIINLVVDTPLGSAKDSLPCEGDGGGLEIGFNHQFLRDSLKAAGQEELVKLRLNKPLTACVIEPEEGNCFLQMVLPVRLA